MLTVALSDLSKGRLVRYAVVGGVAAAVYYGTLLIFVELLSLPVLVATSLSFIIVTVENYILHRNWTFRSDSAHAIAFPKFVFMTAAGFCINWGIMFAGVAILDIHYLVAQTASIAVVVTWNLLLCTLWIFRPTEGRQ
jgi:putative flippase GtrA